MNHNEILKLFYSDEFKDVRFKYYKQAYEQGRFDEQMKQLNKHINQENEKITNFENESVDERTASLFGNTASSEKHEEKEMPLEYWNEQLKNKSAYKMKGKFK